MHRTIIHFPRAATITLSLIGLFLVLALAAL